MISLEVSVYFFWILYGMVTSKKLNIRNNINKGCRVLRIGLLVSNYCKMKQILKLNPRFRLRPHLLNWLIEHVLAAKFQKLINLKAQSPSERTVRYYLCRCLRTVYLLQRRGVYIYIYSIKSNWIFQMLDLNIRFYQMMISWLTLLITKCQWLTKHFSQNQLWLTN